MRIASITISNFKSFGKQPVTLLFSHRLNSFIGLNSSGKTTALEALRKIFGRTNEQQFYREDFHIAPGEDPAIVDSKELYIEVKMEFDEEDEAIPTFFSEMVIAEEKKQPYLRFRLEATWKKLLHDEEGDINVSLNFIQVAEGDLEDDDSKQEVMNHLRKLIEIFYVPAIRKPSEQLRYASGTILFRVLNNLTYDETFTNNFSGLIEEVNTLFKGGQGFDAVEKTLHDLWNEFHKDGRYKDATLSFGSTDRESVLKKLEIHFSPGPSGHRKFLVDDLGDGYRSLFYFTLVCSLLQIESQKKTEDDIEELTRPLLTILAIEEPENHIAPQLLGRVITILTRIAKSGNTQVFLTSHTPAIIKRIDPESIFHFRINDNGATEINHIELPEKTSDAYKYVKEAVHNYPELYFAKLVVIGEGDSEGVIFNRLMASMKVDFDDSFISFAPLGHRFVNHIWRLLNRLKIPYVTLLDMDLEREGGGWGRIKYILKELLEIGVEETKLLELSGSTLCANDLEIMHHWDKKEVDLLNRWKSKLEQYHVFFSFPLDIDFLMLEAFPNFYSAPSSHPDGTGPDIPSDDDEYREYLKSAVQATLKSKKALGEVYGEEQLKLMIWYRYHFLGRGKPGTHIQVLPQINDDDLQKDLPILFHKIFNRIREKLDSAV